MHPQARPVETAPPPPVITRSLLDEIVDENRVAGARYMPVMSPKQAKARMVAIQELKDLCLVEDIDFGVIPGTGSAEKPAKPSLWKPGAEKICAFFGYVPKYSILAGSIEDWMGAQFGEPLFYYHVSCTLLRGEAPVGEGAGSCSSWERKYRYRTSKRSCLACGLQTLIKGKPEYERDPEYKQRGAWICYEKKGGCGAKYFGDDPDIMSQPLGDVANPDVADVINTVQKIADKRAYIAATLSATGASQWFTQDLEPEDLGDDMPPTKPATKQTPPAPKQQPRDRASAPEGDTSARGGTRTTTPGSTTPTGKTRDEMKADAQAKAVSRIDEEKAKLDAMPASFEVQMVRVFDVASYDQRIELFGQLKAGLRKTFGDERGEVRYYDLLAEFGVKKSNEFKFLKPARLCFIAMLQMLRRESERQQVQAQMAPTPPAPAGSPTPAAALATGDHGDDWVPDNIGGAAPATGHRGDLDTPPVLISSEQATDLAEAARSKGLKGPAYATFLKSHGFNEGRLVTLAKFPEMMAGLLAGRRQEVSA